MLFPTEYIPVASQEAWEKFYRHVQDLREVNKRLEDTNLTLPNPYTLLSFLRPDRELYTIRPKYAFFSIPLNKRRQLLFAFE